MIDIEYLKKLVDKKEKMANAEELEQLNLIKTILKNPNCFFDIDMELAFNILSFLGIENDLIADIYYELISPSNFNKGISVRTGIDINSNI